MATTTAPPALDTEEKALARLINAFRAEHGRSPLKVGVALTRAATWMSSDMAHNDNFGHTDTHGRSVVQRLKAFGYKGPTSGENIAGGAKTAAEAIAQWKMSPPHRANLLSSSSRSWASRARTTTTRRSTGTGRPTSAARSARRSPCKRRLMSAPGRPGLPDPLHRLGAMWLSPTAGCR